MQSSTVMNYSKSEQFATATMKAFENPFKLPCTVDTKKFFSTWSIAVKHFAYRSISDQTLVEKTFDRLETELRKIFNQAQPGTILHASRLVMKYASN